MYTSIQWLNLAASGTLSPRLFKQVFLAARQGQDWSLLVASRTRIIDAALALREPSALLAGWLAWQEEQGNRLLCMTDSEYPALLLEVDDPPIVLFCQGTVDLLGSAQIAMVGTRHPSSAGREDASRFASALARCGLTVTSGLAAGIDGAAHRGALAANGRTVAVLGCGIGQAYPREHQRLYRQIAECGVVVSEYPPGTPPRPYQFPVRNRIISGLSLGVLVVEASLDSGSLITARLALEQNREVFAMPGSIHNPAARGCHRLLREGAKLVESVEDVLEEMNLEPITVASNHAAEWSTERGAPRQRPPAEGAASATVELAAELGMLLGAVDWHPTRVEQVILRTGLPSSVVVAGLMELNLRDLLVEEQGNYLRR